MSKNTYAWNTKSPLNSGYYLATWGTGRDTIVSKMYYSTDYGWAWARPRGSNYGKRIEGVSAWTDLPEPYKQ
jgi:hypothetical protein